MAILVSNLAFAEFVDNPSTEYLLEWAIDLFYIATGIETMPLDPRESRIITRAIYQMAWYLKEDHANREAHMSGFSSERIGSYSYSVAQKSVLEGNSMNIPAWDFAIEYFGNKGRDTSLTVSENVFHNGYHPNKPMWL